MNDFLPDAKTIIDALLVALVTVLAWVGRGALKRLDHIEEDSVRKEDMRNLQIQLSKEHTDNSARLGRIENTVDGTNSRIDALFRALVK